MHHTKVFSFPFPVSCFPFARVACGTFLLSDSTRVFRGFSAFPVSRFPRWPQITGTKWPPRAAPQEPLGLRSAVRFSFFLQFLFKCWQHCCDCVKSRAKSASCRGSPAKDLPAVTPSRMPSTICNYQSTSTRLNSSQLTFSLRRSLPPLLIASFINFQSQLQFYLTIIDNIIALEPPTSTAPVPSQFPHHILLPIDSTLN